MSKFLSFIILLIVTAQCHFVVAKPIPDSIGLKFSKNGEVILPAEVLKAIVVLNKKQQSEGFKYYNFSTFKKSDFIPAVQDSYANTPNESPMAILGDFNGDKKNDYILLGYADVTTDEKNSKTKNRELAQIHLAVISNPENQFYTAKEVRSDPYIDPKKNEFPPESDNDELSDEDASARLYQSGLYRHYLRIVCAKSRELDPQCPNRKNGPHPAARRCGQKDNDGILLETYQNADNILLCYECDKQHKSCELFDENDDGENVRSQSDMPATKTAQ